MLNELLMALGMILLSYSMLFYYQDCTDKPSASMGAEMTFSIYWLISSIIVLLGSLPLLGYSYWWLILGTMLLYILSFPIRNFMRYLFCKIPKEMPTGFKQHVNKTEKINKRGID